MLKKTADEPKPSAISKKPSRFKEIELARRGMARMSQNFHRDRTRLGHPILWTLEEAMAAITAWTTDPSLQHEDIWPRTKHNVPLGDNIRILVAPSGTKTIRVSDFRAGLAAEIVGGSAAVNCAGLKPSARVTRQVSAAAVLWITVRESLAPEVRCTALEVVRRQIIAMIIDVSPKVGDVDDSDDSDVASLSSADLRIGGREPAETDDEGSWADLRNRASIHTGGPLFRHYAKVRRGQGESEAVEWRSPHGIRVAGAKQARRLPGPAEK